MCSGIMLLNVQVAIRLQNLISFKRRPAAEYLKVIDKRSWGLIAFLILLSCL